MKKTKDFSARDVGVLLESMKSDISIIAEQNGDIMKKLEDHDKRFDTHAEMIVKVASDVVVLKDDVEIIKEDVKIIKHDLKRKVDIAV